MNYKIKHLRPTPFVEIGFPNADSVAEAAEVNWKERVVSWHKLVHDLDLEEACLTLRSIKAWRSSWSTPAEHRGEYIVDYCVPEA